MCQVSINATGKSKQTITEIKKNENLEIFIDKT